MMERREEDETPCEDDRSPQPQADEQPETLVSRVDHLLSRQRDAIANAANLAAEVFHRVERINWCGFYFLKEDELVLGPFQGKPACTAIALTRGVCGAAASRRESLVVANVHEFPGHIACDPASLSEIAVPILHQGRLIGVFDVDSPDIGRFAENDRKLFERLAAIYVERSDLDAFGHE